MRIFDLSLLTPSTQSRATGSAGSQRRGGADGGPPSPRRTLAEHAAARGELAAVARLVERAQGVRA
eukprot:74373-Prymnesium_polylepis.2